jgi:hypothetical protein
MKMETVGIFAIAGSLFSAAVVYVVLDYRRHGERQVAMENVLSVQAEVLKAKKILLGYTKYIEYLPAGKQTVTEMMKSMTVKQTREHTHIEKIQIDENNPKAITTVIAKYSVEYQLGVDLKPENFDVSGTTSGIEIRISRPALIGAPFIKSYSFEILSGGVLPEEKATLKEIQDKFPVFAQQYAVVMESDASIRALCEKKLIELLGNFLINQPGVVQIPVISAVYK